MGEDFYSSGVCPVVTALTATQSEVRDGTGSFTLAAVTQRSRRLQTSAAPRRQGGAEVSQTRGGSEDHSTSLCSSLI